MNNKGNSNKIKNKKHKTTPPLTGFDPHDI